jgi:hypothetical protein
MLLSKRPEQFITGGWPTFYRKAKDVLYGIILITNI